MVNGEWLKPLNIHNSQLTLSKPDYPASLLLVFHLRGQEAEREVIYFKRSPPSGGFFLPGGDWHTWIRTMKLAVLADIHGNFPALQAVTAHLEQWQPDRVVVAGDIVNRGPRSLDCLRFVQHKQDTQGWITVRGNHEDYVVSQAQPDTPRSGPALKYFAMFIGLMSSLKRMCRPWQ